MIIERLIVGPLETNAYLVGCPGTLEGAVIDPGGDGGQIINRIRALALRVAWIIDTHGHGDHMAANEELKQAFPEARIAIHEADAEYLSRPDLNLTAAFGFPLTSPEPDVLLHDGDDVQVGAIRFRVISVPGHTPGGIALYAQRSDGEGDPPVLFCGDALFAGSMGRTDFPGGSHSQLVQAVKERLLTLPTDTVVYPGHGDRTTIGQEVKTNPFFA